MANPKPMTLETVLALAKRLSTAEKLKLIEHPLVELEPIVESKARKKRRSPTGMSKGQSLTEEEVEEIERKLWAKHGERRPTRVIQLAGHWRDVPFDISTDEIRQARRELSEALKHRAEKHCCTTWRIRGRLSGTYAHIEDLEGRRGESCGKQIKAIIRLPSLG